MPSGRQRQKAAAQRRHAAQTAAVRPVGRFDLADHVARLAYSRKQAAEALGVSLATLDRRVVPVIANCRDGVGPTIDPSLRTRALPGRANARAARGTQTAGTFRPQAERSARAGRKNPRRAREWKQPRRDRTRAQRRSCENLAGWPSTVRAVLARPNPLTGRIDEGAPS